MAKDVDGKELVVGQTVVRGRREGQSYGPNLEICTVSKIDGNKIWLGTSHTPMVNPIRLAIIAA